MDFNINRNFMIDLKKLEPMARGNGPIIVVDDNEDQLLIIKICYSKAKRKNQLICFTSGDTFLSYLTEKNKNLSSMPSLVLLDINMPGKNGFQVLEEIRSRDEYRDVPIIIMFTASDSEQDVIKAEKLRADAFLSKPSHIGDYVSFFEEI